MTREYLEGLGLTPGQVEDVLAVDAKEHAYRRLLADLGVNPKYVERVIEATDIAALELTDDGRTFERVGDLADAIKADWGGFIFETVKTPTTPTTAVSMMETRAVELARKYHERHY